MNRVAITGIGAISPIGNDANSIFDSLASGNAESEILRGLIPKAWEHLSAPR